MTPELVVAVRLIMQAEPMEIVLSGLIGRPYSSRAQEKASLNHAESPE
jgi:hypothetical protein